MTSIKKMTIRILITAGILLAAIHTGQAATTYIYDGFNRLVEIQFDDGTWIAYDYDEMGNRTGKTYYSSTESYFTITAGAGTGGVVRPSSAKVAPNDSQTFTVIPSTGYHITAVTVDGGSVGTPSSYTFSNVTANHTLQATFAINTYTLTASVLGGTGGTINPTSATVNHGGSQTYALTPSTGYHIADLTVDGRSVGAVSSYTLANITTNHTLQAVFAINTFIITTSVNNDSMGAVSPSSPTVNYGASQTFTIIPATGYHIVNVTVDGESAGAVTSYTFTNVTTAHTIQAVFDYNTSHTITTSVIDGYGGTISPASATVNYGGSQTFTFTPDATFSISDVRVDGVSRGAITTYTFSNVTAAHTLQVAFNYSTNPVKNQRTGQLYSSLQTAYAAAATGDVLLCRNFRLVESFTASSNISVTIRGGCNADFTVGSGKTVLIGSASIQNGTVVWENFMIRGSVF